MLAQDWRLIGYTRKVDHIYLYQFDVLLIKIKLTLTNRRNISLQQIGEMREMFRVADQSQHILHLT